MASGARTSCYGELSRKDDKGTSAVLCVTEAAFAMTGDGAVSLVPEIYTSGTSLESLYFAIS